MINTFAFESAFHADILSALPEDTSLHGKSPELRHTYLPAAHAKALRPDNMLVVGMRGSGKSFWWAALQDEAHRETFGDRTGLGGTTKVSTGFGERSEPELYPGKDVLSKLLNLQLDPRRIWQTVVLRNLAGKQLPEQFTSLEAWTERVNWVIDNPEEVERILYRVDEELNRVHRFHLVLFDALDRTADEWTTMNSLVRGLLQVVLDFRSYRRIRLKVFLRPDQIEDPQVATFPDSSKVFSQQTRLSWPRNELYGLFWQYLANGVDSGREFRAAAEKFARLVWNQTKGIWPVPDQLRTDENVQRELFHAITGPWMGREKRRGFPYTWLPNHLGDAQREVSPRSFLAALRHAAEDPPRSGYGFALHFESIKRGVQEASKIRVGEIKEDYSWVETLLRPLSGLSVPCPFDTIEKIWRDVHALEDLETSINATGVRLPPTHLDKGAIGVMEDLVTLGLFERLSDGRVNLPDVYRIGYGIGRKGGVKPVGKQGP
jgi:hypothetical protein